MSSKVDLRIDWATYEAAKYAVENWHYSKCLPTAGLVKVGIWECSKFIGVVIFSAGANKNIGTPYGLQLTEVCELTRIALNKHVSPVSRIIKISIKFLKQQCPGLRLIVSYADASQGHHGGVYQATNWLYAGGAETYAYRVHGKNVHPKTLHSKYGKSGNSVPWLRENVDRKAERIMAGFKHRYLMPLDEEMRRQIEPLRKPYPKRAPEAEASMRSSSTREIGGSSPTSALHSQASRELTANGK